MRADRELSHSGTSRERYSIRLPQAETTGYAIIIDPGVSLTVIAQSISLFET
jgi:hypothetical protein